MEQYEILYRGVHIRERYVHALGRRCVVWYSSLVHRKCVSSTVWCAACVVLPVLDLMECLRSYNLICWEDKSRTRLLSHDNIAQDFEQQQRDEESRDKVVVSVKGLRKEFSNGQVAVKGLNLDLFQDDITVLLGHNGAGKTTTISMLTGLLPPTSGDAIVYDYMGRAMSVSNDLHSVRKSLGICPQHDVLYPDLTVEEHLVLFAIIKGVRGSDEIDRAVTKQIRAIRLEKKRHTASKALSGGRAEDSLSPLRWWEILKSYVVFKRENSLSHVFTRLSIVSLSHVFTRLSIVSLSHAFTRLSIVSLLSFVSLIYIRRKSFEHASLKCTLKCFVKLNSRFALEHRYSWTNQAAVLIPNRDV